MTPLQTSCPWAVAVWGCLLGVPSTSPGAAPAAAEESAAVTTVLDTAGGGSAEGCGRLAVTANGQKLACIVGAERSIVGCDLSAGEAGRVIVAAPGMGGPVPVALGSLDMTVLAAVCRSGDNWSLCSWRLRPDGPADPAAPLQTVRLGRATGSAAGVGLAVSRSREWLVVTGLPEPLPPVIRAVIAGVRVGPFSARHCPELPLGVRPVAVTVGPQDELVLIERRIDAPTGGDVVSFHDSAGLCLLRLDTGLTAIRDAAFAADAGGLWVVADDSVPRQRRGGLWRLDATLRGGHQAVAAVPRADLPGATAVACPTKTSVLVALTRADGVRVVRVPSSIPDILSPGAAP